jgi:hypothetical protein
VQDENSNNELLVSPNPAREYIAVPMKPSEGFEPSDGSIIQIYNALGEKVLTVGTDRDLPAKINNTGLPKGVYFVKTGTEIAKFMKI